MATHVQYTGGGGSVTEGKGATRPLFGPGLWLLALHRRPLPARLHDSGGKTAVTALLHTTVIMSRALSFTHATNEEGQSFSLPALHGPCR